MGFNRHQSFHLRVNWLRKAIVMLKEYHGEHTHNFFLDKEIAEQMGLGKNMVQSLQYWVFATSIFERNGKYIQLSPFGKVIEEYDPYIDYVDTAALLHYNIVSNEQVFSTAWHWYFNIYEPRVALKEQILENLIHWLKKNDEKMPNLSSIKKDIDCIIRTYNKEQFDTDPEDVMRSPLSVLGVLSEKDGAVKKEFLRYENIGLTALMYVLLKCGEVEGLSSLSVEEIETKPNLWGRVFHLDRMQIIYALEKLTLSKKFPIKFIRTNRLDTIQLPQVSSNDFLKEEYKQRRIGLFNVG